MSIYLGQNMLSLTDCILKHQVNLEMISINLSAKKTFFFPQGYGEYTSWYQDYNKFVSQYGVETAAIRPQGTNPPDDFISIAKGVKTALQTLTINPLGATIRLKLGVDGVRRIWRINRNTFEKWVERYYSCSRWWRKTPLDFFQCAPRRDDHPRNTLLNGRGKELLLAATKSRQPILHRCGSWFNSLQRAWKIDSRRSWDCSNSIPFPQKIK